MLPGARLLFGGKAVKEVPDGDDTLAVVNNSTSTIILTDFLLGDKMRLEVCFRQPTNVYGTGDAIVGYGPEVVGGNYSDGRDFRVFLAGTSDIYLDCGHAANRVGDTGAGARVTKHNSQRGVWYTVKGPVGADAYCNGVKISVTDGYYHADGNYNTAGLPMRIFGYRSNKGQRCAVRYIKVTDIRNGATLCSLWPDTRGGFVDMATGKLYTPQSGSVSVVKWETIT